MPDSSFLICFSGISGSGKTTIASEVVKKLNANNINAVLLRMDHYYKPVGALSAAEQANFNWDQPEALKMDEFYQDLSALKQGKAIKRQIDPYSRISGEDVSDPVLPQRVTVVEGLFTLADERIRGLFDLIFMVNTRLDIALHRRLLRDPQSDYVLGQYQTKIRPAALLYVLNLKGHAHHRLRNNTEAQKGIAIDTAYRLIDERLSSSCSMNALVKTALRFSPLLLGAGLFAWKIFTNQSSIAADSGPSP